MLIVLVLFNYAVGIALSRGFHAGRKLPGLLAFGIVVDLAILAYFKYATFLLDNANIVLGTEFVFKKVILPIGISFFTFQKIAYLVDAYRGEAEEYNLLDFSLFVMYFPQLIAGPIVHHKEIIPQFRALPQKIFNAEDLAAGCALFTIGFAKKALVADTVALWADSAFSKALDGVPSLYEAWMGTLSFTMQIYFDFSGYTDMALGLALMIGIRLPQNFNSPYQATSIIDFWRTWHMTLSRFLRDYLYIPLGGNRRGPARRYVNLMLTMLIGGLWHGAAWTFVVWGGLHGLFLVVNHAWHRVERHLGLAGVGLLPTMVLSWLVTFLAVAIAWIFFRAGSFGAARNMLEGLVGRGGFSIPLDTSHVALFVEGVFLSGHLDARGEIATVTAYWRVVALAVLVLVVALMPNSQRMLARYRPALGMLQVAYLAAEAAAVLVSGPAVRCAGQRTARHLQRRVIRTLDDPRTCVPRYPHRHASTFHLFSVLMRRLSAGAKFFVAFFVTVAICAGVGRAAFSVIVDPLWRFDLVSIPGFNAQRQIATNARVAKAQIVCRLQPETVLMGTSRVEVGLNPEHPALQALGAPVYNLALAGSGLHELDLTLRHAVYASHRLKHVLLGIDFLMFNANREAVVFGTEVIDFDQKKLLLSEDDTCWRAFFHSVKAFLGDKAYRASLGSVRAQMAEPIAADGPKHMADWIAYYDRNGWREPLRRHRKDLQWTSRQDEGYGTTQESYYVKKVWRPARSIVTASRPRDSRTPSTSFARCSISRESQASISRYSSTQSMPECWSRYATRASGRPTRHGSAGSFATLLPRPRRADCRPSSFGTSRASTR